MFDVITNCTNQIDTDLLAVEVADDDMIWVIQKEQQIEMILLDVCWKEGKYHIKQRQTYKL